MAAAQVDIFLKNDIDSIILIFIRRFLHFVTLAFLWVGHQNLKLFSSNHIRPKHLFFHFRKLQPIKGVSKAVSVSFLHPQI